MDNEIKFGFWNYLPVGRINEKIVHQWTDMNCNLFMSFRYLENESKKEDMIALLDEAQKVGVKVIINDERNEYLRLNKMSKEEFIKGVKASIHDFGSHPAVFGFYGGDEPFSDQEDNFCFTMKLLKELCPEKTHYGNLLPYWSGLLAEPKENNREDSFYYEKINRLIKEGSLDILAFDQYTQCYDDVKKQREGVHSFINAMHHFATIAKNNNIPLYVSLLAVGHFSYREPTEFDIRWQINVACAMGAKGIIWFYFHQHSKDIGFFNPPFLGERAYITPMYGKIQRQQYVFNERFKDIFDHVDIDNYYVVGDDYGDLNFKPNQEIVKRFDIREKDSLALISFAHYRDDPKHKVVFVVNGNQFHGNAFSVYFVNGKECHFDLSASDMRAFDYFEE